MMEDNKSKEQPSQQQRIEQAAEASGRETRDILKRALKGGEKIRWDSAGHGMSVR